jgi:predicted dehydrogenase
VGLGSVGALTAVQALDAARPAGAAEAGDAKILGTEGVKTSERTEGVWQPTSDRKIRVGIAGYGVCKWGAAFGFQDHPNVAITAVTDLFPDRCQELAKACRCEKTYPSLEEMVKDDSLEAIFVATDAPSHAWHCIQAMRHGKHVATAVPAAFGSLEDAAELYDTVKKTGKKYMMFETSAFHVPCYAMRQIYKAGGFGKLIYSEGEYFHYGVSAIDSFRDWRVGLPPQWYPTHSNAYYNCVTDGTFTEVSCMGMPSVLDHIQPNANQYKNAFGTEIALFRTSEGGMSRMAVSWDCQGPGGELGRVRGTKGAMWDSAYQGDTKKEDLPNTARPLLPPSVSPGGHGGTHGFLMNEFVEAILNDRQPLVDISMALNLTVPGIVAHQSALKDGETLKIPQYQRLNG